ncbi:retron St85 family effector protein [Ciceribacter sp. RN22]|uniref:retron St85 family effector protein n=1 Tax=Ciceribacter sp. RN22 TaxID=2954932 RepID=UPI0020935582|nr:retron St85 family effector protein [Ciceribacter sp. RN22]MCO6178787.1 retron St85 family effector protein [Ciceribacter sp. RN22]
MDHPLRSDDQKSLRRRLFKLVSNGFTIPRQSNIVFVCGGSEPHHMRRRFQDEFDALLPGYEFFEPEFAMRKYWTLGDSEPFDITTFEELIGNLSHSIVIFPEAAGSLAETGYFSARPDIAKKILLAINAAHLATDSFISIGPAKKIADVSVFQPNIQFDYDNPNFKLISQRLLDRAPLHSTRRALQIKAFSDMDSFELFAIIQSVVALLGIATVDDIEFFLRGLFSGHIGTSKTKQIVSILVGSGRLVETGDYGHLKASDEDNLILKIKDGAKTERDVLKVDLSAVYLGADQDFRSLLGA